MRHISSKSDQIGGEKREEEVPAAWHNGQAARQHGLQATRQPGGGGGLTSLLNPVSASSSEMVALASRPLPRRSKRACRCSRSATCRSPFSPAAAAAAAAGRGARSEGRGAGQGGRRALSGQQQERESGASHWAGTRMHCRHPTPHTPQPPTAAPLPPCTAGWAHTHERIKSAAQRTVQDRLALLEERDDVPVGHTRLDVHREALGLALVAHVGAVLALLWRGGCSGWGGGDEARGQGAGATR